MYTINEDGTITRGGETPKNPKNNSGYWFWAVIAAIIIGIGLSNRNDSTTGKENTVDSNDILVTPTSIEAEDYAAATYINISPTSVSFDADGGYYVFIVTSNASWRISTDTNNWGHLTRSGNQLTLKVDENYSSESRSDYFILSAGDKAVRIDIYQSAKVQAYLNVSPTNLSFPFSGGSQTIYIDTNSDWRISVNTASWGQLSRNGNQLIVTIDANSSSTQRTDFFCISVGDIVKRIDITQSGISANNYNSNRVTGSIKDVWVEHNVFSYGNKGMKIHVKFDIDGMLNRTGQAAAYFYYSNGKPIRDTNGQYCTSDGDVATHSNFTPSYENSTFNDLIIFMPYSEMHLSSSASCYFTISIWNGNAEVARSDNNYFDITF